MQSPRSRGLVWCAGDWRSLLPGPAAGLMQLMYPHLGLAVMEHSSFIDDPFGRVYRSIPQIWATLLTSEREERGRGIRDLHRDIRGTDAAGSRYHALDPDTFWWAHATFTWEMYRSIELFHDRQLTPDERQRFYADTVEWYEGYGVSMRPVPPDLDAFEHRFAEICENELKVTPAVQHALNVSGGRNEVQPTTPLLLRAVRSWLHSESPVFSLGPLPADVRRRLGITWTEGEEREFEEIRSRVRTLFRAMPKTVNRRTMELSLRRLGARTRAERYSPEPAPALG